MGTSNSKAAPETIICQSSFDSEVRIRDRLDILRTSESELWSSPPCAQLRTGAGTHNHQLRLVHLCGGPAGLNNDIRGYGSRLKAGKTFTDRYHAKSISWDNSN